MPWETIKQRDYRKLFTEEIPQTSLTFYGPFYGKVSSNFHNAATESASVSAEAIRFLKHDYSPIITALSFVNSGSSDAQNMLQTVLNTVLHTAPFFLFRMPIFRTRLFDLDRPDGSLLSGLSLANARLSRNIVLIQR